MSEHFMKVCKVCRSVYAFAIGEGNVLAACNRLRNTREQGQIVCSGRLDAIQHVRTKDPAFLSIEMPCITLPNGECVSPFDCVHGPPLTSAEFQSVLDNDIRDFIRPYKEVIRKFLKASQGTYALTAIDITVARDLIDDSGV